MHSAFLFLFEWNCARVATERCVEGSLGLRQARSVHVRASSINVNYPREKVCGCGCVLPFIARANHRQSTSSCSFALFHQGSLKEGLVNILGALLALTTVSARAGTRRRRSKGFLRRDCGIKRVLRIEWEAALFKRKRGFAQVDGGHFFDAKGNSLHGRGLVVGKTHDHLELDLCCSCFGFSKGQILWNPFIAHLYRVVSSRVDQDFRFALSFRPRDTW